jgi:hypothetical protein
LHWCGAREMMEKLGIKVQRRQKLKIKKFVLKKNYEKKLIVRKYLI